MDFNIGWGTDQIVPTKPKDYGMYDIFQSHSDIKKQIQYPKKTMPNPTIIEKPNKTKHKESFVSDILPNTQDFQLNEKTILIMLSIILIILCTVMYQSVKQTQETMKLLLALMIAQSKK